MKPSLWDRFIGIGAERAFRFVEADNREVAVIAKIEGILVIHGKREMVMFNVSHKAASKLLWFLLAWRIKTCWFGIRNTLVEWSIARAVNRVPKRLKKDIQRHRRESLVEANG
jgi:hypothetical protein